MSAIPSRSIAEESLLQILRDLFPDRCPLDSGRNFISEVGLTPLQYARYIVAAEESFRTTIPPELSCGIDCVRSLACGLTGGKLTAWGPVQPGALAPYPSPVIDPCDEKELSNFIAALSNELPLLAVHLTGERVIGTARSNAEYDLLVIVTEKAINPKPIVSDILCAFQISADIKIGYSGLYGAPSVSLFPARWVPRDGKQAMTARRVLAHCLGLVRCVETDDSSLQQLLSAIENPLTPAVELLNFANWNVFPEMAGQALTARALSGDPDASEICLL